MKNKNILLKKINRINTIDKIFSDEDLKYIKDKIINSNDDDALLFIKRYYAELIKNYNEYNLNTINNFQFVKSNNIDDDFYVKYENKYGIIKYKNNISAINKGKTLYILMSLLNINTVLAKKIKYNNRKYLLYEINKIDNFSYMSQIINKDDNISISNIDDINIYKNRDDIINIIEKPFKYFKRNELITKYLKLILFCYVFQTNLNLNDYGIYNNDLFYLPYNIELNNSYFYINNNRVDKDAFIDIFIAEYFDYVKESLYLIFNTNYIETLGDYIKIICCEKEEKDLTLLITNNLKVIEKEYKKKIKKIFEQKNINSIIELYKFLNKINIGAVINIEEKKYKIPINFIESNNSINNDVINYENDKIKLDLDYLYNKFIEKINPTNYELTEFIKNITTTDFIYNNYYISNFPLDILINNVGTSFEVNQIISLFLYISEIDYKNFVLEYKNDNNIHYYYYFIMYKKNKQWIYLESFIQNYKGIYNYSDSKTALMDIVSNIILYNEKINSSKYDINNYHLYNYNNLPLYLNTAEINATINLYQKIKLNDINIYYLYKKDLINLALSNKITLIKNNDINNDNKSTLYTYDYIIDNIFDLVFKDEKGLFYINKKMQKEYIPTNNNENKKTNLLKFSNFIFNK